MKKLQVSKMQKHTDEKFEFLSKSNPKFVFESSSKVLYFKIIAHNSIFSNKIRITSI